MSRLTNIRVPKEYDSVAITRQFDRISKALNEIDIEQVATTKRLGVEVQSVRKISEDLLGDTATSHWIRWYEITDAGVVYARGKLAFSAGWKKLSTIEYRYNSGGNLEDEDTWIDIDDPASELEFVLDDEGNGDYPQGGYYYFNTPLEGFSSAQRKIVLHVQIRVRNSGGKILVFEEMMFDADKLPDVYNLQVDTGAWSGTQWEVTATGFADSDTLSVGFSISEVNDVNLDGDLGEGDFTAWQNLSVGNTRFDKSLGFVDPDTLVYVVARPYDEVDKGGKKGNPPYARTSITTPPAPFAITDIGPGDITASMLAGAAQRAQIDVAFAHKGYTVATEDILTYSGTITWGDSTPYALTAGELDAPSGSLYYIFHDPDNDIGDTVISSALTDLQITTNRGLASVITGRRIVLGVYRKGTENGEAAFFVSNTGEIAINAPYVFAAKLSAISADLGNIVTGNIAVTATVEWGAVAGTTDAPENNASAGATWSPGAAGITGMPVRFLEDDSPSVAGLYMAPSYMGFHNGDGLVSGWKTYMDNAGNMFLDGPGTSSLTWSAGVLTVAGQITLLSGSDADFSIISGATKPQDNATAGADWNGNVANIPGRFGFNGDPSLASPSGLYATDTYFGFWSEPAQAWKTYMDSSGNLSLLGDADNSFTWNGTSVAIETTGTFTVTNPDNGGVARIIAGIFNSYVGGYSSYLNGFAAVFTSGGDASQLTYASLSFTSSGSVMIGNESADMTTWGKLSLTTGTSAFSINPAGNLTLKGLEFPGSAGELNGRVLTSNGAGSSSWVTPATGITIDIEETQIQTIGGGSPDQWRSRTVTYTNGLLTSAASFTNDWADIIVP